MMHDIAYNFGFTEEAGNFQANNYGNGGQQGDYVVAFSQYGDGQAGTVNNATFATRGDGGSGQMRMFLWNSGSGIFQVTSPSSISAYYSVGTADFGPSVQDNPATGEVALVDDGFDIGVDGCETIINASEVAGKIAMIDRGLCFFEQKTANAEEAGAIAVIICNFEDSAMGMTGGRHLPGSYDNGVMAHEYGHGISNRLTGGPSAAGCLGNEEQMGEGCLVNMLWDMYWSFVDEYGYDEDVSNATAGNNMAIQLVMDGMKFQPCNPGFADGKNAILAVIQELYNGDNQCLIWDVFARRDELPDGLTIDEASASIRTPNFIGSYLDLSDYIGETISLRFRYGTIVDSDISTNTKDAKNGLTFNVFPNPASDAINIQLNEQDASTINIELFDATAYFVTTDLKGYRDAKIN
ncbi:unnamed protein product [Bathycoccus prasinos]